MKEKAVMGFIGLLTALLITITMVDVLGNAGKGELIEPNENQSSSKVIDNSDSNNQNDVNGSNGNEDGDNNSTDNNSGNKNPDEDVPDGIMVPAGASLSTRIMTPTGYTRTPSEEGSLTEFLRNYALKDDGSKVLLYDGTEKEKQTSHMAVFALPLEAKNLQQYADSVMRVYAEYYLKQKQYEKIIFGYSDGFKAEYSKWIEGNRIAVTDSGSKWVKRAEYDESYESFQEYMRMVFAYAGIWTMKDESTSVEVAQAQVGDVFFDTSDGGKVVMIVDICENEDGKKAYLLASGGKPAQEFVLLANPLHADDPWYYEEEIGGAVETPEFTFKEGSLRHLKY